jgi:hypothetical protein
VREATPEGFPSRRPCAADLEVTAGGNLGKEFRACQQRRLTHAPSRLWVCIPHRLSTVNTVNR